MDDAAAEDLHPVPVVEDLELKRGLGEGEVLVDPSLFNLAEEMVAQPFESLLQVGGHQLASLGRQPFLSTHRTAHDRRVKELDALHLMEGGKVRRVDLVSAVHVASTQESLDPRGNQGR